MTETTVTLEDQQVELSGWGMFMPMLNSVFEQIASCQMDGRKVNYVHLDIKNKCLNIKFESQNEEPLNSYESYYAYFENRLADAVHKFEEGYQLWKDRHLCDPTLDDYQERLNDELKRFLDAAFLIEEPGLINDKKLLASRNELQQWNLDSKEHTMRYAILKEMVMMQSGRFCFDNRDAVGHYLKIHYQHLTEEMVKSFLRFRTVCLLIYVDIDRCQIRTGRELNCSEKKILAEILAVMKRGEWKRPATADNICQMMLEVLNVDPMPLCQDELRLSETLWLLLTTGRGDRVKVVCQNLVGYFAENRLLPAVGSPALCKMFFDDDEGYSNIDKGKPGSEGMSAGFREVLSLLNAHLPRIIS